jgi:hypothetical protein
MSLVIGIKTKQAIIFASDGLALMDDRIGPNNRTIKLYTCSKIKTIMPGQILLGYVGETKFYFHTMFGLVKNPKDVILEDERMHALKDGLEKDAFLTSLSVQITRINQEGASEKLRLFAGYFDEQGRPEIVIFNRNGEIKQIHGYVSLGSGVDRVYADLEKKFDPDWTVKQAVENAIDLIYLASDVPTVNFLPMICVLTKEGVLDLSDKTISLFGKFKEDLKESLLKEL